jgi:hypothetical protein
MDVWRILLAGVVVIGVVLLLLSGPGLEEVPGLVGGVLVEQGTYAIERAGQRVGDEAFTVWLVDSGYRVDSTARMGNRVTTATLVLDPSWNPLYYRETGKAQVSVRISEGRPRVTLGSGLFQRETALDVLPPFAFLGADAGGPWVAIFRYLQTRARAERVEVTAVRSGLRTTASLIGHPPEPVGLVTGGRTLPAERYRVQLGEREIWLYGQGDLLLALASPSEGLVFYLKEVLPDGLRVAS